MQEGAALLIAALRLPDLSGERRLAGARGRLMSRGRWPRERGALKTPARGPQRSEDAQRCALRAIKPAVIGVAVKAGG